MSRTGYPMSKWNGRWGRLADVASHRWHKMSDRLSWKRRRAAFHVQGSWGRMADRLADHRDARLHRRAYRRATERESWLRVAGRAIVAVGGVAILAFAIVRLVPNVTNASGSAEEGRVDAQPAPVIGGILVPDVRGESASDARLALQEAGLVFEGVEAAIGAPGRVLETSPAVGRLVEPDTPVTLIVGVEIERASTSPPDSA